MIHIQLDLDPPDIPTYRTNNRKASDKSKKVTHFEPELEKARAFFTNPENFTSNEKLTRKSFKFTVYKAKPVSDRLVEAYGLKCAYCESSFAAVTPREIEHFRPKSEIDPGIEGASPLKPGYWWLAGAWPNLLISCVDCNRRRNHEVPGRTGSLTLGKGTLFPIDNAVSHARDESPIDHEESARLLLHPALDNPMEHLTFDDEALIHPTETDGVPDRRGETSIQVYALQRKHLVEARRVVLNDLRNKIEQLVRQVRLHNTLVGADAPQEDPDLSQEQIKSLRIGIQTLLLPGKPYLGMLREHIRREKAGGRLDMLLQFRIDLEALL